MSIRSSGPTSEPTCSPTDDLRATHTNIPVYSPEKQPFNHISSPDRHIPATVPPLTVSIWATRHDLADVWWTSEVWRPKTAWQCSKFRNKFSPCDRCCYDPRLQNVCSESDVWILSLRVCVCVGCSSFVRASSIPSASSSRCVTSWRPNITWWSQWVQTTSFFQRNNKNLRLYRSSWPCLSSVSAVRRGRQEVLHHGRRPDALHRPPAAGGVPPNQQGHPSRLPQTPLRLCSTMSPCCNLSSWPRIQTFSSSLKCEPRSSDCIDKY